MDPFLISSILLTLGVGGFVGAVAAAALSAARLRGSFEEFRSVFRAYFLGRNDPDSLEVIAAFDDLSDGIIGASDAIDNLKRSLKRK